MIGTVRNVGYKFVRPAGEPAPRTQSSAQFSRCAPDLERYVGAVCASPVHSARPFPIGGSRPASTP